jgi:hypothetical protein
MGLRQGMSTEALRFAATLKSSNRLSGPLGEEDAVESLVHTCGNDPKKAVSVSNWLLEVAKAVDRFLETARRSRAVTRIAHARLLAIAIVLRQFPKEDEVRLLEIWEKISFRVFGLCRRDARTQVGGYVRLAWDCLNKKVSADHIVKSLEEVASEEKEHSIDWAIENIRDTNCYEGWEEELRYLMYRYEEDKAPHRYTNEQWNRIWQESASHSIEHVYPQQSDKSFVHNLGNLLLLPPGLNSKLQDRKPAEKVKEYRDTGLYIAKEVAEIIEAEGWGRSQIKSREEKLLSWAKETWGE